MSVVKSFTVGNVTYNAVMASAVKQDELLGVMTSAIVSRALEAAKIDKELDDSFLVPMFMAMRSDIKSQVAGILMHQVVINGTSQRVGVEDFSGKMVQYNQLLAQLLRFNLSDFFDWLPAVVAGDQQQ